MGGVNKFFENLDIINAQRKLMIISGIWPSKTKNLFGKFRNFLSVFLGVTLTITMIIQTYTCYDDFMELSEILYITATMLSFMVKLFTFKAYDKYFYRMIDQLKDPDFDAKSAKLNVHIEKAANISLKLTTPYISVCVITCITYGFFPILEDNKPMIFPFPYFNHGPFHYPMYAFQYIAINFSGWNNGSLDVLTSGFMICAAAQLDVIKTKIVDVLNSIEKSHGNDRKIEEKLKKCAIHHMKIAAFVENIENLFSIGLLFQFCSSIVCICNTGFHFMLISIKSWQFVNLCFYFAAMVSQLSMYCWFGNEIILKSMKLNDACYNSTWYKLSPRLSKYIFLIMERSKRPLTVTAYKFATLSLTSYTAIIHWSYSYYALLRRLYKGQ